MPAGNWYLLLPTLLLTLTADAFRAPLSWPAHRLPRRHHHGRSSANGDDDGLVTVPDDEKEDKIGRTTATRGVMPRPPQPHADLVRPPPYLNDLAVGECVHLGDNIRIVKVSHSPPIFYLPQFLHAMDCRTIIDAVAGNIMVSSAAETKQGVVEHRTGSTVAWLGDLDEHEDHGDGDDGAHHHGGENSVIETKTKREKDDDDPTRHATMVAGYLQHLTAHLFLPHATSSVDAERLQVVRYDAQGRYDLHHDGYDRTVTVLTYLNGVAGTWFPFVDKEVHDDNDEDDDVFIPTMQLGNENMLNGRVPGRDGLCFVGREDNTIVPPARGAEEHDGDHTNRVVRVDAGDAICFYNYQPFVVPPNDQDDQRRRRRRPGNATTADNNGAGYDDDAGDNDDATKNIIMAWKTLHCGLPAPTTKWIATNWLSAVVEKAVVSPQEED
jgi:hypothetical protein